MTFDGPNKLLILSTTTLDLILAWSAYKDWLLAGNTGYALAFDTVGGEPINPVRGTLVPLFLFQKNGWKVRPMEANHTLEVTNGMLISEGGGDPFVATLGSYNVKVKLIEPVQAIGYSTTGSAGASASEIAAAVVAALGDIGTGSEPSATAIAEAVRIELSPELSTITGIPPSVVAALAASFKVAPPPVDLVRMQGKKVIGTGKKGDYWRTE